MNHEIIWLESIASGRRFAYLRSWGDSGMEEDFRHPLTSIQALEIVRAPLEPAELDRMTHQQAEDPGLLAFEARCNRLLGRDDLRATWVIRAEGHQEREPGESFDDFIARYVPPTLTFRDIFGSPLGAKMIRAETVAEFEAAGGKLIEI